MSTFQRLPPRGDSEALPSLFSYHPNGKSARATLGSCGVEWDHLPPGNAECSGRSILFLPSVAQIQQVVRTESRSPLEALFAKISC